MIDISSLKRGDILQNKATGESYIVDWCFNQVATAVRTTNITNPTEWERIPSEREVEAKR